MNWKRTARWSWLILPFLLLAVWPAVAAAQGGIRADANAVLYEVTENLKLKPLQRGHREATAVLVGTINAGASICPAWLAGADGKCDITAIATDDIDLTTGEGPVRGTFSVVIQGDNPTDGPELVILRGTLHGRIDLSLAVLGTDGIPGSGDELPLGSITGKWSAKGVKGGPLEGVHARGTFEGTFRLPFAHSEPALYLGNPHPYPVADNERSLGVPTVRLELKFVDH